MMYEHGEPSRYHHRDAAPPPTPPNGHVEPSRYHHRDARPPPPLPSPPNGSESKMVNLLLHLCTVILALASAIVLASSNECVVPSSGAVVTFTYSRYSAFKLLIGCNITAAILEGVVMCLQLLKLTSLSLHGGGNDDEETAASDMDEEKKEEEKKKEGNGIVLVAVDRIVLALLYSAMATTFNAAATNRDQIGSCALFTRQVDWAKYLSLFACLAATLGSVARSRSS